MHGVDLDVLGVPVRVEGAGPRFAEAARDLLGPSRPPKATLTARSTREGWEIRDGRGMLVSAIGSDHSLAEHLVGVLNRIGLDHDVERLHLHSALVDIGGAGILLCGPSGAGKTTIAAGLVERGCRYLTDETVPISAGSATIEAYPKPLTLKGWSLARFAPWRKPDVGREVVPASTFGEVIAATIPSHIVFPRYEATALTSVKRLAPSDAIERLVDEALDIARYGPEALHLLAGLVGRTSCWSMDFGSLNDGVIAVEQIALESPTPTPRNAMWHSRSTLSVVIGAKELRLDAPALALRSFPKQPTSAAAEPDIISSGGSSADRQRNQDLQVATAIDRLHSQGHSIILAHGLLAGELAGSEPPVLISDAPAALLRELKVVGAHWDPGLVDGSGRSIIRIHHLLAESDVTRIGRRWFPVLNA